MAGPIKKKAKVKRAGKSGHGGVGRRRGVIAGGAHGTGKTRIAAAKSEPVCLTHLELKAFFQQAVGVHPSQGAKVMKRPLHKMRNTTMQVAIRFINQRLRMPAKSETRESSIARKVLIGIRRKMQAVMKARAEKEKK